MEANQIVAGAVRISEGVGPVVVGLAAVQAQIVADHNAVVPVARHRAAGVLAGVKLVLKMTYFFAEGHRCVRWLSCFTTEHPITSAADVGAY